MMTYICLRETEREWEGIQQTDKHEDTHGAIKQNKQKNNLHVVAGQQMALQAKRSKGSFPRFETAIDPLPLLASKLSQAHGIIDGCKLQHHQSSRRPWPLEQHSLKAYPCFHLTCQPADMQWGEPEIQVLHFAWLASFLCEQHAQ